ncbi:MAG: CBS domain-containing protein [Candidatus Omnitrophica bacterium]|nr:CBS domain-containing protein [Candidatus Omnitrophota bacterium]
MSKPFCPSCGHEYIAGDDYCESCLHSLMTRDLPRPRRGDLLQKVMMTAPVAELVTGKDLLVAGPADSIQKIVKVLRKEKKDCVIVVKSKKLVGILSLYDLLFKAAMPGTRLADLKAEDVMTRNPEFVRPEDPIALMVNRMSLGGYRHVPVLSAEGVPLSIVSIKDVLAYLDRRD